MVASNSSGSDDVATENAAAAIGEESNDDCGSAAIFGEEDDDRDGATFCSATSQLQVGASVSECTTAPDTNTITGSKTAASTGSARMMENFVVSLPQQQEELSITQPEHKQDDSCSVGATLSTTPSCDGSCGFATVPKEKLPDFRLVRDKMREGIPKPKRGEKFNPDEDFLLKHILLHKTKKTKKGNTSISSDRVK